jgi:hypothetical protein
MIRDNTGRFAERPFYQARELDDECERLIRDLLLKRHGKVDYPVATDDLTVLIEMHDADLDPFADLSAYGADVEGVTRNVSATLRQWPLEFRLGFLRLVLVD